MKKLENLGRKLSKDEQKKITGGSENNPDSCSVTCDTGYYACCYQAGLPNYEKKCECKENGTTHTCDSGGVGSSSCSSSSN